MPKGLVYWRVIGKVAKGREFQSIHFKRREENLRGSHYYIVEITVEKGSLEVSLGAF